MMENLLTIDNGNTSSTVAFYKSELDKVVELKDLPFDKIKNIDWVLTSDVGNGFEDWNGPKFVRISDLVKDNYLFEMPIDYSKTLGEDRLAGAYWVFKNIIQKKTSSRVMLIDAGTFTTIDLITEKGFEGGCIFPGTNTLLQAYANGNKLPTLLAQQGSSSTGKIPKSTNEAILSAVQMAEKGLINEWKKQFKPDTVVLSGGLSYWYKNYLPSSTINRPNIVHLGLCQAYKDMPR